MKGSCPIMPLSLGAVTGPLVPFGAVGPAAQEPGEGRPSPGGALRHESLRSGQAGPSTAGRGSSRLRILPVAPLGRASMRWIARGYL